MNWELINAYVYDMTGLSDEDALALAIEKDKNATAQFLADVLSR